MKTITLTKGKFTVVDDSDYEGLSKFKWCISSGGYAKRALPRDSNGKQRTLHMHTLIAKAPDGSDVDHINGEKLDNRRTNLRICSRSENRCNCEKRADNKSGFKGVHFNSRIRKYVAQIGIGGRRKYLGCYSSASAAAIAYNNEAVKLHKEFARIQELKEKE